MVARDHPFRAMRENPTNPAQEQLKSNDDDHEQSGAEDQAGFLEQGGAARFLIL